MRVILPRLYACLPVLILMAALSCEPESNPKNKAKYGVDGRTPLPEAVDIGLVIKRADGTSYPLKLASFNLGASKEYEYGDYYAWGETEPYYTSLDPLVWSKRNNVELKYDWSSYLYANGAYNKINKYCYDTDKWHYWDGPGDAPDGLYTLEPGDDAANRKLGGLWRMPTDVEMKAFIELTKDKANYRWGFISVMDANGEAVMDPYGNKVKGWMLTQLSTGNSVFFPAAGFCYQNETGINIGKNGAYWSSSLYGAPSEPSNAAGIGMNDASLTVSFSGDGRFRGRSIRPVCQ